MAVDTRLWPAKFAAAIFDFDGTIAETHSIWHEVDQIFLGSRGIEVDLEYQKMLSMMGFQAGARYTIERFGLRETVDEICDEWNRLGKALYHNRVRLRPGAQAYIEALRKQGIPCALATVNDAEVLESCRHIDARSLFDQQVYGKDVAHPKDHPDIYLEAARRLGVAPANCIVFEDLAEGIRSAHSVGMLTCAVASNDPMQDEQVITRLADIFLHDWRDICLT